MVILLLGILLGILSVNALFAQEQAISVYVQGKLVNEKNEPMSFGTAVLYSLPDSVFTKGALADADGNFEFDAVLNGTYYVEGSYLGYSKLHSAAFSVNQSIENGHIVLPTLQMQPETVGLQEVTVTYKKPLVEMQADKMVVNVESSAIAQSGSALDVLRRSPGVTVNQQQEISLKGKQGVLVMVDDKPTQLTPEQLGVMLQSLPANTIDRVEIIANPSAKYDAAGNAGIINIRLKKNKNTGINGSASANAGYGWNPVFGTNLNLNYRNEKVNLFGNYGYTDRKRGNDNYFRRFVELPGDSLVFDQNFYQLYHNQTHTLKTGADWFVTPKTTVGVLFNGQFDLANTDIDNHIALDGFNKEGYTDVKANTDIRNNWKNTTYNLNLKHQLNPDGSALNVDLDYAAYRITENSHLNNRYLNMEQEVLPPYLLRSNNNSNVNIAAAKADYSRPLKNKAMLETGVKSSYVWIDNGIFFETQAENGIWLPDAGKNNDFRFTENINAAYVNYSQQVGKWAIQAGLRAEQTNNRGNSVTLNRTERQNYLSLFPSANVSYTLNDKNQLAFAYSRRIDRPGYTDLNPFTVYIDQFTSGRGNPFLKPQFTHSVSLSHTYADMINTSVSYSRTTDALGDMIVQSDTTRNAYQIPSNFDHFDNASVTVSAPIPVTKWWNAQLSLNGFYSRYQSVYLNQTINNSQFTGMIYLANNITLPKNFSVEVAAEYHSPLIWGIYHVKSNYSADLGISKSFGNGSNLKFSLTDVFNTNIDRITINDNNLRLNGNFKNETRVATLTYTCKFGNSQVQNARRRSTATDDERSRVKGQ